MNVRDHTAPREPEHRPTQDDVAAKAYAIYLKEGRPHGHAKQNWLEAESALQHTGSGHPDGHGHHDHHAHMAADFRQRFWISLALTLPILLLSPLFQTLVGLREAIRFSGDLYVLFPRNRSNSLSTSQASRARVPKAGSRAGRSRWSVPATCTNRTSV